MKLFWFSLRMKKGSQEVEHTGAVVKKTSQQAKACSEINRKGWTATGKVQWHSQKPAETQDDSDVY